MTDRFKGNTTLQLTQIDLKRAIQYWLNTEIMAEPVSVEKVEKNNDASTHGSLHVNVHLNPSPEPPEEM